MKILLSLAVATAVWAAAPAPAAAQKLDLSTVKCKEFLASGQENISLILMWLTGYFADQDASPIVDFDKMKSNGAKLGEYCRANPETGLITATEETFEE